jgi:hypothetical protein
LTWPPLRFWRRSAWLNSNWNLRAAAALVSDRLTDFELRKSLPCAVLFKADEMCYEYNSFVERLFEGK